MTQRPALHHDARAGFGVAPILYMLGLIGVGAGLLFSSYSQSVKGNIQLTNSFTVKSDLDASATTLAATSVLGATDPGTLCPPQGGIDTAGSNCVSAPDKMIEIYPTMNVTLPDPHLPTNYANSHASGSPVEVGVFTSGAGVKQLDPWGHYYIYCRWENESTNSGPAIQILSAGSTGVLNTSCGAATASVSPDNYLISMNASVAINRSAVWQTGTVMGSTTPEVSYGTVGHQLVVDANGNLTVPGNATVDGNYTSPGNITTTAGNVSAVGGSFAGNLGVTGDLSAENGSLTTASGGTLSATNGAFAVGAGGVISAASGTFLVGSGGTVSAANGNFAVDNTGSLTIGTGGFTVAAANGNTSVGGALNVAGIATTNVAANIATTVGNTGTTAPLLTVGKKIGSAYLFSVDQFGVVTAPSFVGDLSGSVNGGTVTASYVKDSGTMEVDGNYTSASGNITIGGVVTAAGFSGPLSLGGGAGGVTLSGVVPIANGGTGASTASTAITNLFTGITGLSIIDGSNLASGTVTSSQLNSVVAAGVYNSVTVGADGRVVSGSYTAVDATRITDGAGDSVSVGTGAINFGLGNTGIGTWTTTGLMVGTTSPTAKDKLDVYGSEAIGSIYAGTVAAPTDGLIVAGSVGIGTSSPTSALSVNGTVTATNFVGSGAGLTSIGTTAITGILAPANGGTGINNGNNTLTLPSGGITLGSASLAGQVAYYSGTNTLTGTSDMYISGLNVGIGTATPGASLDLSQRTDALALPAGTTGQEPIGINGMIRYNSGTPAVEAYVNGSWTSLLSASAGVNSGVYLGSSAGAANPQRTSDVTTGLYSDAAGTVEIASAGTKTFSSNTTQTLIPTGSVGIGTTNPLSNLQVNGSLRIKDPTLTTTRDFVQTADSSGVFHITDSHSSTDLFAGNANGVNIPVILSPSGGISGGTHLYNGAFFDSAGGTYASLKISEVAENGTPSTPVASGITGPAGTNMNTFAGIFNNASTVSGTGVNYGLYVFGSNNYFSGNVGIGSTVPVASLDLSQEQDAVALPVGTTGTRPSTSINGMIRYNSSNGKFEAYQSGAWQDILTSAIGNGLTLGTALNALNPTKSGDNTTGLYSDAAGTVEIASSGIKSFSNNSTYTLIPAGSVGIGTTSPLARLSVSSNTSALQSVSSMVDTSLLVGGADGHRSRVLIDSYGTGTSGTASIITFRTARGTAASPSANMLGDTLANISVQGYGTTGYQSATKGAILVGAAENWTDATQADYIAFNTVPSGTANTISERMRIDSTGYVGIGSTSPRTSLDLSKETDALSLPAGTTGQEPVGPNGMIRYNSTTPALEAYVNNSWTSLLTSSSLGSGLTLGTALTALNPTKNGDTTTGLYSDAAGTVEIASAGTKTFSSNSTSTLIPVGSVAIGAVTPSYPLTVTSSILSSIAYFRSTGALNAGILIDNAAGGNQTQLSFMDAGAIKWQIGKQGSNNSFFMYDSATAGNFLTVSSTGLLQMGESSQLRLPATGNVGIGVTAPASIVDATGNIPSGGTGYNFTSTSLGSSTTESGVSSSLTYSPSTAPVGTSTITGLNSAVTSSSANANSFSALLGSNTSVSYSNAAGTLGTAKGIYASAKNAAAGTITSAYGLQAQTVNNATGSILSAAAGQFAVLNNSTGSISNAYGVNIATPVNAGTVGLTYGLYINSQTAGTQTTAPYGVYQVGAADRNYFAGNIGIGSTSPIASLDLSQKTDAVALPVGTTGTRPGTSINGMLRYNSTNGKFEAYQSGAWQDILTSAISNGLTLGTALTALNPTKSGDTTTGLYSDATSTVEIAGGGAQLLSLSPSYHLIPLGSVGIGSAAPHAPLEIGNVGLTALFGSASAGYSAYVGFNESLGAPRAWVGYNGTTGNAIVGGGAGKGIEFDVNAGFGSGQAMVIGSAGQVGIGSLSPIVSLDLSQKTDAVALPVGTTGTRPGTSINGMLRYNSTNGKFEAYQAGTWQDILTSAVSNGLTLGTALTALNPTKSGDTTTGLYSDATSTVEIAGGGSQLMSMSPTYHLIPAGSVGINIATPDAKLEVSGTVPYNGTGNSNIIHVAATSTNAGSSNESGIYSVNTVSPSSAPGTSFNPSGVYGNITTNSANLNSSSILAGVVGAAGFSYIGISTAALYGVSGTANNSSTGTLGTALGVRGYAENASTGTIGNATAASFNIKNDVAGIITTGTALMVGSPSNGGTIGSTYGLYINSQTIGTQTNAPYALYQSGASDKNYFAGAVNVANTTAGTVQMLVGTSGNPEMGLINNSLVAQNNPLVQAGDEQILFSSSGQNTGNLVIGPWSSTSTGLRMTSTGKIGIGSSLPRVTLDISQLTDALALPAGTTGQEPVGPNGMIRYNSTTPAVEAYVSNSWQSLLTSASLGSTIISLGTSATTTNPAKSGDVTTGLYSDAAGTVEIASAGTKTFSSSSTLTFFPVGSVAIGATTAGYPLVVSSATSAGLGYFRSTGALNAIIQIDNSAGGNQSTIIFQDASLTKWQIGKSSNNSFFIYDVATSANTLTIGSTGLLQMGESSQLSLPAAGKVGIGIAAPTALLNIAGAVSASSWTTTGIDFATNAAIYTDTSSAAAATVTNRAANSFGIPTLASTNAITVTNAANLYIAGAPLAGTNTAITNADAVYIAAGFSYFGGNVGIGSTAPLVSLDLSQKTDALAMPVGTTGQRPTGANGMVRYNATIPGLEGYVNGAWTSLLTSTGSSSLTLGTSLSALNPAKSGDSTTGLYSDATSTVEIAGGGSQLLSISPTATVIPLGSVAINGAAPLGALDVSNGNLTLILGADSNAITRTNATQKIARIGVAQYINANAPFTFANLASTVANNTINIGGGTAGLDAATIVSIYTAANQTTATGTERMRVGAGGLVAIGTTSQANMLDVYGGIAIGSATGFAGTTTAPANGMIVAGSVGIGTAAPSTALHVSGSGPLALIGDGGSTSYMGFTAGGLAGYANGRAYFGYDATNSNAFIQAGGAKGIEFAVNNNTVLSGIAMVISSAGQVGVGSTLPRASLDMSQKTDALSLPAGTTGQEPTTSVNGMIRYNSTTPAVEAYVSNSWQSLLTNASLGSTTISLGTSSTTTNPAKSGDITTGLYSDAAGTVEIASAGIKTFSSNSTSTFIPVGSLGIGTTSPNYLLEMVSSNSSATVRLASSSTANGPRYVINASGVNGHSYQIISGQAGDGVGAGAFDIYDGTVGADRLSIGSTGNVGIGTKSPGSALQVNGGAAIGYATNVAAPSTGLIVSGNVGIGTTSPTVSLDLSQETDALAMPVGTTGQRPSGANGMVRYNSSTPGLEAYVNGSWMSLLSSGGASTLTLGTSAAATNPSRNGDLTTGFYTAGAGLVDVSASGTQAAEFSTTGINIATGGLNIAGLNGISFPSDYLAHASIAIGSSALASQPLGTSSTGVQANTAIGYQAAGVGTMTSAATNNTAIGFESMTSLTSASLNTAVGSRAMASVTSGPQNTAVGSLALNSVTTGGANDAVGSAALVHLTTGASNEAIGQNALSNLSSGGGDIAVGYFAGTSITGSNNVVLGYGAGAGQTSGNSNVAIGNVALAGAGARYYNVAIGDSTLLSATTGSFNTGIGYQVGKNTLSTGSNNILIGTDSSTDTPGTTTSNWLNIGNAIYGSNLYNTNNPTGVPQIAIGSSLTSITAGAVLDLSSNTSSANSSLILPVGTTGTRPVGANGMVRYNSSTPGLEAYVNGSWASLLSSGGASTLTLGTSVAATNPSRNGDLTTGFYTASAGKVDVATSGVQSVEFSTTGINIATGGLNIAGLNGLSFPKDGTPGASVAIGPGSLASQPLGGSLTGNVAVGYQVMPSASMTNSATANVGVGPQSLFSLTSGSNNIAIGNQAAYNMRDGSVNIAFGYQALASDQSGAYNVAIGTLAAAAYTGDFTIAIGYEALASATAGGNVAVGYAAGGNITTGSGNTLFGTNALQGVGAVTGNFNTAIGYEVMRNAITTASQNTVMGAYAATTLTTGFSNTILGYNVANTNLSTGQNNILIGTSNAVDTPAANTNNFLNISNVIFATGMTGTLTAPAGNVGIGTETPQNTLDVYGGMAIGSSFAGSTAAPTGGMITSGSVGVGVASPAAAVDIAGAVKVAGSSAACGPSTIGSMHYNSTGGYMEICQ